MDNSDVGLVVRVVHGNTKIVSKNVTNKDTPSTATVDLVILPPSPVVVNDDTKGTKKESTNRRRMCGFIYSWWCIGIIGIVCVIALIGGLAGGLTGSTSSTAPTSPLTTGPTGNSNGGTFDLRFNSTGQTINVTSITKLRCTIANLTKAVSLSTILFTSWMDTNGTVQWVNNSYNGNNNNGPSFVASWNFLTLNDCATGLYYSNTNYSNDVLNPLYINITIDNGPSSVTNSNNVPIIDTLYANPALFAYSYEIFENRVYILPSPSSTATPSNTPSPSSVAGGVSATSSSTPSAIASSTSTGTATAVPVSSSPTPSTTPSETSTATSTATSTSTSTSTGTSTATASNTPSNSPSTSVSATPSPSYQPIRLLRDINPVSGSGSGIFEFFYWSSKGVALTAADNDSNGAEPWVISCTNSFMLKDIDTAGNSDPRLFTECGNYVYFTAFESNTGRELYRTDITTTTLVADVYPGVTGSDANFMVCLPSTNSLIFDCDDGSGAGQELCISDGTSANSRLLKDIFPGSLSAYPKYLTIFQGKVYFSAGYVANDGEEVFVSDGTSQGTFRLADIDPLGGSRPMWFTVGGNSLWFVAEEISLYGRELYRYDGNTVSLVYDFNTGITSSNPNELYWWNNALYLRADDGVHGGYDLWRTDGVTTTFLPLDTTNYNGRPSMFTPFNFGTGPWLFFAGEAGWFDQELWATNGTITKLIRDIYPGPDGSFPDYLAIHPRTNLLYFQAEYDVGAELYVSNGTDVTLAMDIDKDPTSGTYPSYLTALDNCIVFTAYESNTGDEIYVID